MCLYHSREKRIFEMLAAGGVFPEEIACVRAFLYPSSAVCCAFVHDSCTLQEQQNVTEHLETGHCVCNKTDLAWQRQTDSWTLLMRNQNRFQLTFSVLFLFNCVKATMKKYTGLKKMWVVNRPHCHSTCMVANVLLWCSARVMWGLL